MRKYIVSAMVLLLSGWSLRAQATAPSKISDVRNTSYERDGQRVLRHEAVIPAPCSEVWKTLTTEEGLRTFNTPVVEFELKTGGKYQTNYRVGSRIGDPGTIYNTVLSFVPEKMLSFKIGLTDEFPTEPREAGTLFAVIELEPVDKSHTNVAISMLGWGMNKDWDDVYKFFDRGNSYTMQKLLERFKMGPVTWKAGTSSPPAH